MLFQGIAKGAHVSWIAAAAGAAMLAASAAPAAAFPLPSGPAVSGADRNARVERVWWDRWGNWHPNHPRWGYGPPPGPRWGWGPPPPHYVYGYGPVRHCWINRWGYRRCAW